MNWWEDAEAKALRAKTPAGLGQTLWQRCLAAGLDQNLSAVPAYDLASLHDLCADFVKLVEGLLVLSDGDSASLRRQALLLGRWARHAHNWTQGSAGPFNALMDSLDFEPDTLAEREEVALEEQGGLPEETPKLEGRYRHWHLVYERLDLKFASVAMDERVRRGLARSLARIYEQSLITFRLITSMEKESQPRFRPLARVLLEINTTWHFDLGPYHLGHGELRASGISSTGLQTWLLLAFGA